MNRLITIATAVLTAIVASNGQQISIQAIRQSGNCVVAGVVGNPVLNCPGLSPDGLRALNEFFSKALRALSKQSSERLQEKNDEIQRLKKQADDWQDRYINLSERLAQTSVDDARRKQVADLMKIGDLKGAAQTLDQILQTDDEKKIEEVAQDEFNSAEIYRLQSGVEAALPRYAKAYRYRPDNWEYARAYARALIDDSQFVSAEELLSDLVKTIRADPHSASLVCQRCLAAALEQLGRVHELTGKNKEAEKDYLETITIYKGLEAQHPGTYRGLIASELKRISALYAGMEQWDQAQRTIQEALRVADAQRDPPLGPSFVAGLHEALAFVYVKRNYPEKAKESYMAALAVWEHSAVPPESRTSDAATKLNAIGKLRTNLGDLAGAKTSYSEAAGILSDLLKVHKDDIHIKYALARTWMDLGETYFHFHRFRAADTAYMKALPMFEELGLSDSAYQDELGFLFSRLAVMEESTGDLEAAETHARDELDTYTKLATADPKRHEEDIIDASLELGRIQKLTKHYEQALSNFQKALSYYAKYSMIQMADTQALLGETYAKLNQVPEAKKFFADAVGTARKDGGAPAGVILTRAGDFERQEHQLNEAEKDYLEAIEFYRKDLSVGDRAATRLAQALMKVGVIYSETGNNTDAERALMEAAKIQRAAVDRGEAVSWVRADFIASLTALRDLYTKMHRQASVEAVQSELRHYDTHSEPIDLADMELPQ